MKVLSRREFFRTAAAAAALPAVGPGLLHAAGEVTVNGLPASILGRTGLKVTRISLGGVLVTEPSLLVKVIDQGINFVHTSAEYTNGRSLEAFGKAFKENGLRQKVVLAIKERPEAIDSCLKTLGTDYIDILVPPLTSPKEFDDQSLPEAFDKVKKAGKAGFLGWAGHNNTTEAFRKGAQVGWLDVTLMSYANIKDPSFLEAAKQASQAGIGIFTMKGLPKRNAVGASEEERNTYTTLCSSMLGRQYAHSVLASMGSFQSLDFFRGMLENRLGYYDPGLEERYWASQEGSYCAMCGACEKVCPEGRFVPPIIRYRMYWRDYGMKDYARACYSKLERKAPELSPGRLELCESVCPRRLPIREMVAEAHALLG